MSNLRKFILYLIIILAIIYNMERLDLGQENIVDIRSYVYVLILAAVVSNIAIQRVQKIPIYSVVAFWVVVYFAIRLTFFRGKALWGGLQSYLTITELALIIISILLSHTTAYHLREMEIVIEKVSFPSGNQRVMSFNQASADIKTEFVRSRRYNRPMTLIVVQPASKSMEANLQRAIQQIQTNMLERYMAASLAHTIRNEARRIDIVIEGDKNGRFIILCPETNSENSQALSERLQIAAMDELGLSLQIGLASFPDQALTFEDLLKVAENHLEVGALDDTTKEN